MSKHLKAIQSKIALKELVNTIPFFFVYMTAFFMISLISSCKENPEKEFVFMDFLIPISISPANGILTLQDTLWVEAEFSDLIYEINTDSHYRFIDYNFGINFCGNRLINKSLYQTQQPSAINDFTYLNKEGKIFEFTSICGLIDFIYINENNIYNLKIGMIPKNTGVFSFGFIWPIQSATNTSEIDLTPFISLEDKNGKKQIPVYNAFYCEVNNRNVNFDLFLEYCRSSSLEYPSNAGFYYEQVGSFTFQVTE
jgi:hypothetical protein